MVYQDKSCSKFHEDFCCIKVAWALKSKLVKWRLMINFELEELTQLAELKLFPMGY